MTGASKMMKRAACVAALCLPTVVPAQSLPELVEARRADMKQMSDHFSVIGNMVRGRVEYDPAAATQAAEGIWTIAKSDWTALFPAGSAFGEVEKSEASEDIWKDWEDFLALQADLVPAAEMLARDAGQGFTALRPAVMGMAKACSACHTPYRVSN
jgi:cytochrome c556